MIVIPWIIPVDPSVLQAPREVLLPPPPTVALGREFCCLCRVSFIQRNPWIKDLVKELGFPWELWASHEELSTDPVDL